MEPIKLIQATKIVKEFSTKGSGPLLVLVIGGDNYIVKTTSQIKPTVEVINELLCGYFAQCWSLKVPDFSLVQIADDIYRNYIEESGPLSSKYRLDCFGERKYFGSKRIENPVEMDVYFREIQNRNVFKRFKSPTDLIKIGVFDQWIGNYDRRPDNPNILLDDKEGLFEFHPIDHTAAFAHLNDYKKVREVMLYIDPAKSILNHQFSKKIVSFVSGKVLQNLKYEFLESISNTIDNLDFIFSQVPAEWGFSKKHKAHLKSVLSDSERNKRIASSYLTFLR